MTYRLYEKGILTCDGCGVEKTVLLDKRDNPTVREQEWFDKLMSDGWEYDEEKEEHYCPACSVDVSQSEVE